MTSKIHNIEDRISKRALAGLPTTVDVDSRSFEIIITTETPYERYIPDPRLGASKYEADWIKVSEVLPMAAMDFSRVARMPLVDNHAVGKGLDGGQIGRVDNVRIEGDKVIPIHFHYRDDASCSTIPDAILECKDEPVYRGRSNVSAADLLEYADEFAIAGADCRSKLGAVRKTMKGK